MTNRRKFIAGLGALASGSAAAMGTGAMSTQESVRNADVDVVTDTNGGLGIKTGVASLENDEYAEVSNGQLTLQFDGLGSSKGINADTTYYFDNVFQLLNQTPDLLSVSIDKSGLDNSSAFTFYAHYTGGSKLASRDRDSQWSGAISSGFGVNIGVKIETPDKTPANWETGSISIIAED